MKPTTLCFVVTDTQILLGRKKRGFGADKMNGFGGKREGGDYRSYFMTSLEEALAQRGLSYAQSNAMKKQLWNVILKAGQKQNKAASIQKAQQALKGL